MGAKNDESSVAGMIPVFMTSPDGHGETAPALIPVPRWMKYAVVMLGLFKLWLVSGQALYAIGWAGHDDRLYLSIAYALLKPGWLGNYTNLTLAKGPFYPFFIAVTCLLGVPLLLAQHLFYIAACTLFMVALRPQVSRPALLLLMWGVLVFNPMTYTGQVLRVIREGIYPALTIFVISCAAALLLRHDLPLRRIRSWSIGLGCSLSAFWLTREEGVWLVPSIALLIGFATVNIARQRPPDWRRLALTCCFPFVIWQAALGAVAALNKAHYGIFTVVELKSRDFVAAYGALSRVKQADPRRYVPVPRVTREHIYEVSPSFAELRPFLEGPLGQGWTSPGCEAVSICDDIAGGWFVWALRDAVAAAGHYSSGRSAARYYKGLAEEINAACSDRRLACGPQRASLMPPWRHEYNHLLMSTMLRPLRYWISFSGYSIIEAIPPASSGTPESLIFFQHLTRERLSLPTETPVPLPTRVDRAKIFLLAVVGNLYSILASLFALPALGAYLFCILRSFVRRTLSPLMIINTALLGALVARLFLLSIIDVTSFPAISPLYLTPAYPLVLLFTVLALIDLRPRSLITSR